MPTLLELAGIPVPDNVDGQSLVPVLRGEADSVRSMLHGEHAPCYDDEQGYHFLTDGRMKYIWRPFSGKEELFDLQEDPHERHDLGQQPEQHAQCRRWRNQLIEILKGRPEGFSDGTQLIAGRPYAALLPPPYQNTSLPVSERVEDLLARMRLKEKVDQLRSQMVYNPESPKRDHTVGHIRTLAHFAHKQQRRTPAECAEINNADIQRSIAASRWGIPVLVNGEALHGAQWGDATCFPQSMALAATWDESLMQRVATAIAKELKAVNVHQVFAPVINIGRDSRWGRTQETYNNEKLQRVVEPGVFELMVGSSSEDIRLAGSLMVACCRERLAHPGPGAAKMMHGETLGRSLEAGRLSVSE